MKRNINKQIDPFYDYDPPYLSEMKARINLAEQKVKLRLKKLGRNASPNISQTRSFRRNVSPREHCHRHKNITHRPKQRSKTLTMIECKRKAMRRLMAKARDLYEKKRQEYCKTQLNRLHEVFEKDK